MEKRRKIYIQKSTSKAIIFILLSIMYCTLNKYKFNMYNVPLVTLTF